MTASAPLSREQTEALLAPLAGFVAFPSDGLTFRYAYDLEEIERGPRTLSIFTLVCSQGSGGSAISGESAWTCGVTRLSRNILPHFSVVPRTLGRRLLSLVRPEVKVDSRRFAKRFVVRADDEPERVKARLTPSAQQILLAAPRPLALEGRERYLALREDGVLEGSARERFAGRFAALAEGFD